jgi:hypothetical protein
MDAIIFFPLVGGMTIYTLATGLSTILFFATAYETAQSAQRQRSARDGTELQQMRCIRWRIERNFWISLLALILWLVLHRIRALIKEVEGTKELLSEEKKKNQ